VAGSAIFKNGIEVETEVSFKSVKGTRLQIGNICKETSCNTGSQLEINPLPNNINKFIATVTAPDIPASNGVVHIIDHVLNYTIGGIIATPEDGTSAAPLVASNTIPDVASETPDLSTLVAALKAGALVDQLSGEGPFTVFAPTNEAFAKLPKALLAALLEPANKKYLDEVLTYHVVWGDVHSKDLKPTQEFFTIEGKIVTVVKNADGVFVNGAQVTTADVYASNGVVHIINEVLIPPGFVPPSSSLVATNTPFTIVDIAQFDGELSTLVTALQAGALIDTLSGKGPFTVFTPTNAAFAKLPETLLASLLEPSNKKFLDEILTYHVVAGGIHIADLKPSQELKTVGGNTVKVLKYPYAVFVNDNIVVGTGGNASNGVVYPINEVLIPPGFVPPFASSNIVN